MLDALCEDLAHLEQAPADTYGERFRLIAYRIESLQLYAGDKALDAAGDICARMLMICRLSSALERLDESFLDLAYAFCEAYVDAFDGPAAPAVTSWLKDSEPVLGRLQHAEAVDAAKPPVPARAPDVPAPPAEVIGATCPGGPAVRDRTRSGRAPLAAPLQQEREKAVEEKTSSPAAGSDPGSPESLLETAQWAIAHGDMPGAKVLALQAVAHLARAETAKAETRVQEAEVHFQQNAEHIEQARAQVKKAEQDVSAAESHVAEGGSQLADARAHSSLVEEKVVGIEKRVSEIEEQIRALEAARDAEAKRVEATRRELEQARDQERKPRPRCDGLKEVERAARARLEESRQSVKDLQRNRLELEEMLSRARETLTHHRSSMADIEKTINQLRPAGDPAAEQAEDLLF